VSGPRNVLCVLQFGATNNNWPHLPNPNTHNQPITYTMSAQAKTAAHPYGTRHQQRKESEPEDLLVSKLKRKRELRGAEGGDDSDYLEESDVSQEEEEEEEEEGCCNSKIEATKPGKKQQKSGKSKSQKKRRVRYGWACSMCKFKHRSCDGQRPCNRCKSEGFAVCGRRSNPIEATSKLISMLLLLGHLQRRTRLQRCGYLPGQGTQPRICKAQNPEG